MNRSCTDIICCCLFIAFCIGMVGTAAYGFLNGDPYLLLTPWDQDGKVKFYNCCNVNILFIGNGCGYTNATIDYPYIYWVAPDISKLSSDPT